MSQIKRWEAIPLSIVRYCEFGKDFGRIVYDSKVSSKGQGRGGHNKEPKKRDNSGEQEVGMYPIGQIDILSECDWKGKSLQLTRTYGN